MRKEIVERLVEFFDFFDNAFEDESIADIVYNYAEEYGYLIHVGSSRIVVNTEEGFVLKFPFNKGGAVQQKGELSTYAQHYHPALADIHYYVDNFIIVAEDITDIMEHLYNRATHILNTNSENTQKAEDAIIQHELFIQCKRKISNNKPIRR